MENKIIIKSKRLIFWGLLMLLFSILMLYLTISHYLNDTIKWYQYPLSILWILAILKGVHLLIFKRTIKTVFEVNSDLILSVYRKDDIYKSFERKYDCTKITAFNIVKKYTSGIMEGNKITMTYDGKDETLIECYESKLSDKQVYSIMNFIFKQNGRRLSKK